MPAFIDLKGRVFGRLTVVERAATKAGLVGWLCRCECGGSTIAMSYDLTSGKHRTCPCSRKEKKLINLAGRTFGHLTVIERAANVASGTAWRCRCDCGKETVVPGCSLKDGKWSSCGCHRTDTATKHGHGNRRSLTYQSWQSMKRRCLSPSDPEYFRYGGGGVSIFPEWIDSFVAFLRDMGERPSPQHTIDRIDNEGSYEPGNCRWATKREQGNNRRNNRLFTHRGETLTLTEWGRRVGMKHSTLRHRLGKGWTFERALGLDAAPVSSS